MAALELKLKRLIGKILSWKPLSKPVFYLNPFKFSWYVKHYSSDTADYFISGCHIHVGTWFIISMQPLRNFESAFCLLRPAVYLTYQSV